MLVLFETPAGFALFKLHDEKKLSNVDKLYQEFEDIEKAKKIVTLKSFEKFEDTADALTSSTALLEGKVSKSLKKFLKKTILKKSSNSQLAVIDPKLGSSIKKKLGIDCLHDSKIKELMRCIRFRLDDLVSTNLSSKEMHAMVLGLAHSMSRYKLKFSPDKVDNMIVQAIGLLDDLNKELNVYSMKLKEWYGLHFPELVKVVTDNLTYARVVKLMGHRSTITSGSVDLTDILEEEVAEEVCEASKTSMGTEVSEHDLTLISALCDQIIDIIEYRDQLNEYMKNRMKAIAPNFTMLAGELIAARLVAHAGSLMNLAKQSASTIQIYGAEKALFRALKTNRNKTPKFGIIYDASVVRQAQPKNQGKMARVFANKAALTIRADALGDKDTKQIGIEQLEKLQTRQQELENIDNPQKVTKTSYIKYEKPLFESQVYNPSSDSTLMKMEEEKTPKKEKSKKEQTPKKEKTPKDKKAKTPKSEKKKDKESSEKKKKRKRDSDAGETKESKRKKEKKSE